MSDDPYDSPEWREFADDVRTGLVPKLRDSGAVVSLLPADPADCDPKYAVEIGMSVLMDKPIVVVVRPGTKVPDRLVRVADHIVEADLDAEGGAESLMARLRELGYA